ncbi:MAG: hypothetical protein FD152_540 [Xanthobacteraceae bacterium]|nr:MAG: hypothetical protein FD152_540 [Xanthobacteraceae bacterium]
MAEMPITHEQAATAVRRLIKGAFRRDGEFLNAEDRPRFSIPCRPEHDDDTVASAYVKQQADTASTHTRAMEALREAREAIERARHGLNAAFPLVDTNIWPQRKRAAEIGLAQTDAALSRIDAILKDEP